MKLRKLIVFSLVLAIAMFVGFWLHRTSEDKGRSETAHELVLHDNVEIIVDGIGGGVRISSVNGLERRYSWGSCTLSSELIPRTSRWYGLLGAYDPASSFFPYFGGCNGTSRTVVQEGQLHFDDADLAAQFLQWKSTVFETTWSSDGLVVSWGLSSDRYQLNADVILLCLNGAPLQPSLAASFEPPVIRENADGLGTRKCRQVDQEELALTRNQLEPLFFD